MGKLRFWSSFFKIMTVVIALLSIAVFVVHTDFSILKVQLEQVGFKFGYILILTFLAYLLGTLGWRICLGDKKKNISILRLFIIRQVGETLALYNPTSVVAGDLLKAKLLQPYAIDEEVALRSVTTSRITATLSQIALFFMVVCWLLLCTDTQLLPKEFRYIIAIVILLLLYFKIVLFKNLSLPLGTKPTPKGTSLWNKFKYSVAVTHYNCKVFYQQQNKLFWFSYLLFSLHWVIGSMEFYYLLSFLGYPIQLVQALLLDMTVLVIKSIGAAVPAQIGIEELANKITLFMIGLKSAALWISISILRRLRQLIWCFAGIIMTLFLKKEVKHAAAI